MRAFTGWLIAWLGLGCATSVWAEPFVFRGALEDGTKPAEGAYALKLTLYRHEGDALPLAGPLELLDVRVNQGQFAAGLDFGTLPPDVADGWLEVSVKAKDDASDYVPLGGRTRVGLKATEACPASWSLSGNALTNPSANFLGTTDAQALELRANNQRVARFESIPLSVGHTANVLLGSPANSFAAGVRGTTIAGGGGSPGDPFHLPNSITDDYGTVGGGSENTAGDATGTTSDAIAATVGGGSANIASGYYSVVGGGYSNDASAGYSVVDGGVANIASGLHSAVGGGVSNAALALESTVGGGNSNIAFGIRSTVGGGFYNCAGGFLSWAGGNRAQVRLPNGTGADPLGSACDNVANVATAGDTNGDEGTFIWADSQGADFVSTGPDQFNIRASGGVRLNGDTSQFFGSNARQMLNLWGTAYAIGVQSDTLYFRSNTQFAWFTDGVHSNTISDPGTGGTLRMRLDSGGTLHATAFNPTSDRDAKTAFKAIDATDILAQVLELPLSEWSFKTSAGQRHIGPMAQDFHAAFGLNGEDDKHIATVDADGVALAAIQGLNAKLEAELAALRTELALLRSEVAATKVAASDRVVSMKPRH